MKHAEVFPKGAVRRMASKALRPALPFMVLAVLASGIIASSKRQLEPRPASRWAIAKSLHFKPTRGIAGIPDSCFIPDGGVLAGKIVEDSAFHPVPAPYEGNPGYYERFYRFFLPSGQELSWQFVSYDGKNYNTLYDLKEKIARGALKVCGDNGGCGAYYEVTKDSSVLTNPASGEKAYYWHYLPAKQAFRSKNKEVAIRARHTGNGCWLDYQVDSVVDANQRAP
ncbi:MAG: hypothetical protein WC717_01665 [Candidatus Micrarchaeia archaeon]|jgi:hypothetical protein